MKSTVLTVVGSLALICLLVPNSAAIDAHGSVFGSFQTARAIGQGAGALGAGVGLGDNATTVVGWFQYGLSRYLDGRLKLGIADPDFGETEISFGADIVYQLWDVRGTTANSFDLGLGGFFEYVSYDPFSVFQVGGHVLGSYPFELSGGTTLSPYGRFNIRMERYDFDFGPVSGDESELEFGLNAGVAWKATPTVSLFGEFQIDGNDAIFLGAALDVM